MWKKVAPLKKISISRLELLSCVLLGKLLKNAINKDFFIEVILKLVYNGSGALKKSANNW